MKLFHSLLLILIIALNFLFVNPSLADAPKITKNPDYIEVTKSLNKTKNQKFGQIKSSPYMYFRMLVTP